MRRDELRALGRLAGESAGGLTARIHQTHRAVAQRAFHAAGPVTRPVALIHDGIAAGVYGAVGAAGRHGLAAAGELAAAALGEEAPGLEARPSGRRALAMLNGLAGDRLHAQGNPLALRTMLAGEIGPRSPRIAVLVHGLGQDEAVWRPLGAALRDRLGVTPVAVRYNSGRPVDAVAAEVSALLERLVAEWPGEVREIVLVGHALGTLVAEAAIGGDGAWGAQVGGIVALGTPYHGLAAGGALRGAARTLGRLPETRAAAGLLEARSAGLKAAETGGARRGTARLRRLYVSGSVTRDPTTWPARRLGDLVVTRDSAWAHTGGSLQDPDARYVQVGGASHFGLPGHPGVIEQIVRFLGEPRALPAPVRALPAAQRP
jgi:hypothetical protein